jgi:hypothetical protein
MDFCDYITSIWKDDLLKKTVRGKQPPWGWIAWSVCELLAKYPTGLTDAIIRQEVQQQWEEARGNVRTSSVKSVFGNLKARATA